MADNVAVTAGTGTSIAADEVVDGTLGTVKVQFVKLMDGTLDGTAKAKILAASTAPQATDPALVVAISPNSVNANLSDGSAQTSAAHTGAPTINLDAYSQYETVAVSATDQVMGASGGQYDYLAGVLIIPGTAAAGAVSIKDGNGSAISIFAGGGVTALPSLVPFLVPLGLHALAGTTPGWKITTGTNVTAIGIGKFT